MKYSIVLRLFIMCSDTVEKLTDEFGGLNASDLQHLILDNKYIKECYSNKKRTIKPVVFNRYTLITK